MSKIKHNSIVYYLSSEENTLSKMPKYNGFGTGHGVHGETKYSRVKQKRDFKRLLKEELK